MTGTDRNVLTSRRGFVVLVGVSGCLDRPTPSHTPSSSPTRSAESNSQTRTTTRPPAEEGEAAILVDNGHDERREFDVGVSDEGEEVFGRTVAVPADTLEVISAGIDRGAYGVSVSVPDVGEASGRWGLSDWDVYLEIELNRTGLHVGTSHADPTTSEGELNVRLAGRNPTE